jgi:hypothetical protein
MLLVVSERTIAGDRLGRIPELPLGCAMLGLASPGRGAGASLRRTP